jgi:DoxX-like protein
VKVWVMGCGLKPTCETTRTVTRCPERIAGRLSIRWGLVRRLIEPFNEEFMRSQSQTAPLSRKGMWTGRVLSGLAVLFLLFDSLIKVLKLAPAVEGTTALGYPAAVVLPIGLIELVCLVLYVIPRTSVLSAILLTGYLGGAIATHVRVGSPLLTHIRFPVYVAALIWGGLFLRDDRLRTLIPLR